MDKILEDSSSLTHALLMSNEEQYDTRAQSVVTRLKKLSSQDLLSATNLNVQSLTCAFIMASSNTSNRI